MSAVVISCFIAVRAGEYIFKKDGVMRKPDQHDRKTLS